ncbi:hypothetical protein NPA08_03700 [Mycoplasmopsis citelli]|uniref:hypothetical protein n=1 Tax=Mycoplasmopsis citelli TaxID=171281 RepID=UPI0021157A25|nr:hypothetical protein [Mycoplasmopsis citelli]UUD36031.1 hypothetical protein NPA08_03700 [Mycoplasmopsis citelli]
MPKKQTKKSFVIASSVTAPLAVALGATLFSIHSNEAVKNNNVYQNLLEGENLFKLYSPYFSISNQEKNDILSLYSEAKNQWNSPDKKLQEKLTLLDGVQAKVFDFYINNLDKVDFKEQEPTIFWKKILDNQEARIRESDLQNQLTQLKEDYSFKFFEVLYSSTNEQKQNYLKNIAQEISKLVVAQNEILSPFINLLEGTSKKIDAIVFDGLKKEVSSSLVPLYSRIIDNNIHLNEVQIASQDTTNKVASLQEILEKNQVEINEINEYLKLIEPYTENVAYNNKQKANVKNFLASTKINLNIAQTAADINLIRNNLVTFYEQISDSSKSVSEIKQVIGELNDYVDKFDDSLDFNKKLVTNLIEKTLLINDKNNLITQKSELFSEFYSLKFVNELLNDLKNKVSLSVKDNLILQSKAIIINSQIDTIFNKKLPNKQLASEFFSFYNTQIKELDLLKYLNNELKLIESQSTFVKNLSFANEDILNKLKELHNQVVKTYSNDVSSTFLTEVKNKLNEEFRLILKGYLKQLILKANEQLNLLRHVDNPINKDVIDQAKDLEAIALPMTEDFNPVPTVILIENIKAYNFKIQNLINANKQSQTEIISEFADDYLTVVFSGRDPKYIPTKNEQQRIDLYNDLKKRLDELRKLVNEGNGTPEIEKELEEIKQKLQNIIDTADKFREISNLDKEILDTIKRKLESENANELKPYVEAIEKIRSQLDGLFTNPNATNEQVQDLINQLNKALKDLNEVDTKELLEKKINDLKKIINDKSNPDNTSAGSSALNDRLRDLIKETEDVSNQQKSNQAIDLAKKLIEIAPVLFELELNKKRLLEIIEQKSSDQYSKTRTIQAIKNGKEQIVISDDLVARLNDPNNIPNLEAFENEKLQLFLRGNEILLAYEQDKIETINELIQATVKTQTTEANSRYKTSLERINNYALVKKSELEYEKALEASTKMEKLLALANVSSQLLDSYNQYNVGTTLSLAQFIDSLLFRNELLSSDSDEVIERKTQTLLKAQTTINTKKEFLDVYNLLPTILTDDANWKIYTQLKHDITLATSENNEINFNNNLTVEQINAKKVQLSAKIASFKRQKETLMEAFNEAIKGVDDQVKRLDNEALKMRQSNPSYTFNNYYLVAKKNYNQAKAEDQRENVNTEDINNQSLALQIAYQKDLALNKLKDIETFAGSETFVDTTTFYKGTKSEVLAERATFDSLMKLEIAKDNLSLDDLKTINEKIKDFFELFNFQKNAIDYIESLINADITDLIHIHQLTSDIVSQAINSTLPASYTNYNDLKEKYSQLRDVLFREFDIDKIRLLIEFTLENTDNTKGPFGIVKTFNDGGGANFDTGAPEKLESWVDEIKRQTRDAIIKDQLIPIINRVNKIKQEVSAIADLSQAAGEANEAIHNLTNDNLAIVKYYSVSLAGFIVEARNSFFIENDQDNNNFYNTLKDKISFSHKKILQADLLAGKLEEIREIVNDNAFNLRSIGNQSGIDKLNDLNNYLRSFETTAQNEDYSQVAVEKITLLKDKATQFKNIIDAANTVLTTVNNWLNQSSASKITDANSLLQLVWDAIPTNVANPTSVLGKQAGNTYNVNDLFDLSSTNTLTLEQYTQLSEKIVQEITTEHQKIQTKNAYRETTDAKIQALKAKDFTAVVHNDFKDSLLAFLTQLEQENNSQISFTTSPDESGDLNQTRAKVEIVGNNFDVLKTLAQKAFELANLNNQIISTDNKVIAEKTKAQELLNKVKSYYDDSNKMSATGNDSIASVTMELEDQFFRLTLWSKYQIVKNLLDNDKTLDQNQKTPIQAKLDAFNNEYNDVNSVPRDLFNKYFRDVSDVGQNEPASAKNNLIKYVLENSINLKKVLNDANAFLSLEDQDLDDADVQSKFNVLKATINNQQNNPTTALSDNNNSEEDKVNLFNALNDQITNLVTAKKNQIDRQLILDNQVKDYVDQNASTFNKNMLADPYVRNFLEAAITNLQNASNDIDNISYSEANILLKNAKSVLNDQIFDLYTKAKHEVQTIQNSMIDYFNDFDATHVDVRNGAGVSGADYAPLVNLNNLITTALAQDLNSSANYVNKINTMIAVITSNADNIISTFATHVKDSFKHKFNPKSTQAGAGLPGFYVKLFEILDPLQNHIAGKNQNHYLYNDLSTLETQYNLLKSEFKNVNDFYGTIIDKNDATSLSLFAVKVDSLNKKFVAFQNQARKLARAAVENNPLKDIFADLYIASHSYDKNQSETDEIKNEYQTFKATLNQKIVNINELTLDNNTFNNLTENSNNGNVIFDALSALYTNKDWINDQGRKEKLFSSLNVNPNRTNPLEATANDDLRNKSQFDQKFKVIIAKDEYTRRTFEQNFSEIQRLSVVSNPRQTNRVRIDNNDNFLDMFKQFAFTKKDIQVDSDVKSIFSPVTFKVYIEKYDPNNWFMNVDDPRQQDVDRRSLKAKLVYVYDSNAANVGKIEVSKEVVMTFKTVDIAQIPDGNSSIFFDPSKSATSSSDGIGYSQRFAVLDVDEAGWNIAQSTNANDTNLKNQVILKTYNLMKKAIFGFNDSNSTIDGSGIIKENNNYNNFISSPTNSEFSNVSSIGGGISNRISAFLNKDNRNSHTNYAFDIQNQESIAVTFNTQLSTTKDDEYLRIFPLDQEKGFAFLQIQGGFLTGYVPNGTTAGTTYSPQVNDNKIHDPNSDIYRGNANWWEIDKNNLPSGVNMNLYKFNIDYNPVTRKVYIYNSWLENSLYLPNRGIIGAKIIDFYDQIKNNNLFNLEDRNFLKTIGDSYNGGVTNFIPSPEQLARVYSIVSANTGTIFSENTNPTTSKLPTTSDEALGSVSFPPVSGGQPVIVRSIVALPQNSPTPPPTDTFLNPENAVNDTKSTLYTKNPGTDFIVKKSARVPLYSASINKFWFKIRNR